MLAVNPCHWSLRDPEWVDKRVHATLSHLHPACQTDTHPHQLVSQTQCRFKQRLSIPAWEAEMSTSTRFKIQRCRRKKKKERSSLIYNLAMVIMKNWVIVFRHNRQLLKEIKRRSPCSPSWRLHSSFENSLWLHPSGISTAQLARMWPQLVDTMTGTDASIFWELNSLSPPKWPIYLHVFQNYHYKETTSSQTLCRQRVLRHFVFSKVAQRIGGAKTS